MADVVKANGLGKVTSIS